MFAQSSMSNNGYFATTKITSFETQAGLTAPKQRNTERLPTLIITLQSTGLKDFASKSYAAMRREGGGGGRSSRKKVFFLLTHSH